VSHGKELPKIGTEIHSTLMLFYEYMIEYRLAMDYLATPQFGLRS
jgi:hypothetical protein